MPTVREIYEHINSLAPFSTQEDWDNSGFLIGDGEREVTVAAMALDITLETLEQAKAIGAQLIISHHPVIFKPLKQAHNGEITYDLIASGLSAVCAHTNLDAAAGGVNDVLANLLGLENVRPVRLKASYGGELVRIGEVNTCCPLTAAQLTEKVAKTLGAKPMMTDGCNSIKTVAVCGGAGDDFIWELAGRVDAFVTGEISHHKFIYAKEHALTAIAAGHFETENPVMPALQQKLKDKFGGTQFVLLKQTNPVIYY